MLVKIIFSLTDIARFCKDWKKMFFFIINKL